MLSKKVYDCTSTILFTSVSVVFLGYKSMGRADMVVPKKSDEEMREILSEIQSGEFAREWILENMAGRPVYNALKRIESEHLIEKVGKQLREMMGWIGRKG